MLFLFFIDYISFMFQVIFSKVGILREKSMVNELFHNLIYPSIEIVNVTKISTFNFKARAICFS